jgi:nucleotide-binding universal stress UspA family protein
MPVADVDAPIIESILHPSDLSEASQVAFARALKAALVARARLTMLHVSPRSGSAGWEDFPGVQDTLERWGARPRKSDRDGGAGGIGVVKIVARHRDPVDAVLAHLRSHPADLIVLAASRYRGRMRWLRKATAVPVAQRSGQMTLFVPAGLDGFVSLANGGVSLQRVLVPIALQPRAQPAINAAVRLVRRLRCAKGEFVLVHIGTASTTPAVRRPTVSGWTWTMATGTGDVVASVLRMARETEADLIVMSTDGRNGFLDALRGSHSERILRDAPCPLLAIPEGSFAAERLG